MSIPTSHMSVHTWQQAHNNALETAKFFISHSAQSMHPSAEKAARAFIEGLDALKISVEPETEE